MARRHRPLHMLLFVSMLVTAVPGVAAGAQTGQVRTPAFVGSGPWERVPREEVATSCGLDPALLEAVEPELGQTPYAIVRYGQLCWAGGDEALRAETYGVMSVTKTLAALLFGIVAARTDVDEQTRVWDWVLPGEQSHDVPATLLAQPPANPDARVFHILTMTGHNPSLAYGTRLPWMYESTGQNGLNSLIRLIDNVVEAHPEAFPGSTSARELAINELFVPLGMTSTTWDGAIAAFGMESSVYDMAKLGELMLRKGRWGDTQIIDEDYIHRMTHPQVEDIQTHYGYLTWLNAAAGQAQDNGDTSDLTCSPFAGWRQYPHAPMFDAPDDSGGAPYRDGHDVGVFWAQGLGGQHVIVHRALDLVIVVRDEGSAENSNVHRPWHLMRPALVAEDRVYDGDEEAFCAAYRRGAHAPGLLSPWDADSGSGSVRLDDETSGATTAATLPPPDTAPAADTADTAPNFAAPIAEETDTSPSMAAPTVIPADAPGTGLPATGGGAVGVGLGFVLLAAAARLRRATGQR